MHLTTDMTGRTIWRLFRASPLILVFAAATAATAKAQWSRTYESSYLPGNFNWQFRSQYPGADRLFNGFDYGHAILYETLWANASAPVSELEQKQFDLLTKRILRNPPRLPLEETPIEVAYAKLAPEAKAMLDWAHQLHRQVYDVWADPKILRTDKDIRVARLLSYYHTRKDLAFSSMPKSMDLMDGQIYSLTFRQKYPKFNGLIWSYHWLQIGLYEPLVVAASDAERKTLVSAAVGRFWQMLNSPPDSMPFLMPMTAAVAPAFAQRYPDLAGIFDNLHMMHDVVADILASPEIPRSAKRQEILRAAALFRSDSEYALTYADGVRMVQIMGANNMGGPAVGFSAALPTPSVERGMSMAGMIHGSGGVAGSEMSMPGMQMAPPTGSDDKQKLDAFTAAFARMMADPVIRERVATDPVLQRMLSALPEVAGSTSGGMNMPGMSGHSMNTGMNMPGMSGGTMGGMNMPANSGHTMSGMNMSGMNMSGTGNEQDRREAIEFVVRLFSDTTVRNRIDKDPALQRLWADPDVQKRLEELGRMTPPGSRTPTRPPVADSVRKVPPAPVHKH